MVCAVQSAITAGHRDLLTASWDDLAAPVWVRKHQEEKDRTRQRELSELAARKRMLEEQQRQRREEEARIQKQDEEYEFKRIRFYDELKVRLPGVCLQLPYDMSNIETLEDIPFVRALLGRKSC